MKNFNNLKSSQKNDNKMTSWIVSLLQQLLDSLSDRFDIEDMDSTLQIITVFEQVHLTKTQLVQTGIIGWMKELHSQTPNDFLKYRLEHLMAIWRDVLDESQMKRKLVSSSVFEAVIKDDDRFFETTNVPELLHRLLKSLDKRYRVTDMATVLHTIEMLEEMDVSVAQIATTHFVTYIRRIRRRTTNTFLEKKLKTLIIKWRNLMTATTQNEENKQKQKRSQKHQEQPVNSARTVKTKDKKTYRRIICS